MFEDEKKCNEHDWANLCVLNYFVSFLQYGCGKYGGYNVDHVRMVCRKWRECKALRRDMIIQQKNHTAILALNLLHE